MVAPSSTAQTRAPSRGFQVKRTAALSQPSRSTPTAARAVATEKAISTATVSSTSQPKNSMASEPAPKISAAPMRKMATTGTTTTAPSSALPMASAAPLARSPSAPDSLPVLEPPRGRACAQLPPKSPEAPPPPKSPPPVRGKGTWPPPEGPLPLGQEISGNSTLPSPDDPSRRTSRAAQARSTSR